MAYDPSFGISFYPFVDFKVTTQEKPVVPSAARERLKLNTVAELELYMFEEAKKEQPFLKSEDASCHLYEVKLQILDNNGKWTTATMDNFPEGGIPVTLPYPKGTDDYWNYDFTVAHMFAEDHGQYLKAGDIEYPEVTKTPEGLQVWLSGASPVLVAWQRSEDATPVAAPQTPAGAPKTGDATPLGALTALLALSACGMVALVYTSRKRRA